VVRIAPVVNETGLIAYECPRLRVRDKCALAAEGAQSQSGAGMSVAGESRHT
jgi:hypothetical protein